MAKIRIDENSLRQNSHALNTRISDLQNLNSRLEELINRIDGSWEGQASESYIATMRKYSEQAKKMINVLNEYKKYIDTAINNFSNVDRNAASRIRGSF